MSELDDLNTDSYMDMLAENNTPDEDEEETYKARYVELFHLNAELEADLNTLNGLYDAAHKRITELEAELTKANMLICDINELDTKWREQVRLSEAELDQCLTVHAELNDECERLRQVLQDAGKALNEECYNKLAAILHNGLIGDEK